MLVPTFVHISEIGGHDILIGMEGGFAHYAAVPDIASPEPCRVFISDIRSGDTTEGIYRHTNANVAQTVIPEFKHNNNSISITFSSNHFESSGKDFQYKLMGFDEDWSEWTSLKYKEYTNLPAGHYTFVIHARNNSQLPPSSISYQFSILPPWYLTWYAMVLYCLLA